MRKLKLYLKLDHKSKKLLIEAFFLLGWARVLKSMDFSKIASKIGQSMNETTFEITEERRKLLRQVSQMIYLASKYTFWESECLVKAYTAMKMLKKRGIESTLYLGTGRDENGHLIAHAWVRSGPCYITGYEGMERFTVVATFANHVSSLRGKVNVK